MKKAIAFMTLGIDVSRLFSEMVLVCGSTTDLVQKKMVYLYLVNYAEQNSDLAILAMNTLMKDCRSDDPSVRGMALRSLCSMKLGGSLLEYLDPAIRQGLKDVSPYVRRTAVIGCLKLFHAFPAHVMEETNFLETLFAMLSSDKNTDVVHALLATLDEILACSELKGLTLTPSLAYPLLNQLSSFSEWGQARLLSLLSSRFTRPKNDDELFDLMNVLDPLLINSSTAVVMGCCKVRFITASLSLKHTSVVPRLPNIHRWCLVTASLS